MQERIPCDIIIGAIGQAIDSDGFMEEGVPTKWAKILSDKFCKIEGMEGVFAGGDCASGPSTAIRAIEAGKTAAGNIDTLLCQNRLKYQKQPIRQEVLWDVSIWLSEPQVTAMMTLILWKSA